jgi:hypothetical protein
MLIALAFQLFSFFFPLFVCCISWQDMDQSSLWFFLLLERGRGVWEKVSKDETDKKLTCVHFKAKLERILLI